VLPNARWRGWETTFTSALDTARERLGAEAYEAAWRKGLGMTPDEAVACALG
jgi:hypothetical protein